MTGNPKTYFLKSIQDVQMKFLQLPVNIKWKRYAGSEGNASRIMMEMEDRGKLPFLGLQILNGK